jgi:hypothetical protein
MNVTRGIRLLTVVSLLGALLVIAVALAPSAEVTAAWEKMDVCHVTNVPEQGDGHVISIADPAWPAHEAHGDKEIGEGATDDGDGTCHVSTLVAVDDEVPTPVDTPVTIDVLANDVYIAPVVVSLQVGPSHGLVGPWVDGTITYYPDPGFFGTDSFTYQICDTSGQCDTATVTIIVGP